MEVALAPDREHFSLASSLVIRREKRKAQYFTEALGKRVALDMVLIPSGTFLMGSPQNELERDESESPQHQVTVPSFFMGRYPVTQAQWQAVAAMPEVNSALDLSPSKFKGNQRPVENVSWYDAVEFCDRLSRHTKRPYRLPSEAEWEYACRASPMPTSATPGSGEARRAGTTTPFHFGETILTDLANYDGTDAEDGSWSGSYGQGTKGVYREKTTPVGSFPANTFGLYDMHGNVWEWCLDPWHDDYEGAPTDGGAWIDQNAESDAARVLRGGSWDNNPRLCRSATRDGINPANRYYDIGFRVVCSAPRTL